MSKKKYIDYGEIVEERFRLGLDEMSRISKVNAFNHFIDTMPSADVEEVRHGEWADYAGSFWGRIGRMDLRCSLCGKRASSFVGGTEDWWDNYKPNYCPNCGAKMDKE